MPYGGSGTLPGVGELLSQTWQILTRRFGLFLGIATAPIIAQAIAVIIVMVGLVSVSAGLKQSLSSLSLLSLGAVFSSFAGTLGLLFVLWIVILLFHLWSQIALIYAVVNKESAGIVAAYKYAIRKTFSYLWIVIASAIIIVGGMFLFFIPGVIFAVWFSLAAFVLVNEDTRGMSAILKSKEYMRGQWFAVFWRWFAFILIVWLISIPVGIAVPIIAGAVFGATASQYAGAIISLIFLILVQAAVVSFGIIYGVLIYGHLRALRGSFESTPSSGQKIGFSAIGIVGILSPLLIFGFIVKNKITSFDMTKGFKSDYNYNANINWSGNINSSNQNINNSSVIKDSDNDRLSDNAEKSFGTNPDLADTDFDGLTDGAEVNTWRTSPTIPDTDGDGFRDGDEVKNGYDPLVSGKTQ